MIKLKQSLLLFSFFACLGAQAQIDIKFCPVTKTVLQSGNDIWGATIELTNNTGQTISPQNNVFRLEWPSVQTLIWPFTNFTKHGDFWEFGFFTNWPGTLAPGASTTLNLSGATYAGRLGFPPSGTYTEGDSTYTVTVSHCAKTTVNEIYPEEYAFQRSCLLSSPTSGMCLGEAATEIWNGEGIFDVMVPKDRPTWALGTIVAHRLFTNLVGKDIVSPNFFTAISMIESRMSCDTTIVPNKMNYFAINSNAAIGTGVYHSSDNCYQLLPVGYAQVENFQPNLFSQTNQHGTANYSNVSNGGSMELGALAVMHYHYQNIKYWDQIHCYSVSTIHDDANDPYAVEKILYHTFHDGINAGTGLLAEINSVYTIATSAVNMNSVVSTGGAWSSSVTGSQKVGNFVSLLDGNTSAPYTVSRTDTTTQYYGCYQDTISWSDVTTYFDKVKILYPKLMESDVQAAIKAVFDGLNAGNDVVFTNLGPVVDEIVLHMGGHDPSLYIKDYYGEPSTCAQGKTGALLSSNDSICPGEQSHLELWLAGDSTYSGSIKFPSGFIHKFKNVSSSPYLIEVNEVGTYELAGLKINGTDVPYKCDYTYVTIPYKNISTVEWDKSAVVPNAGCLSDGDLILKKTGSTAVTVSYTKGGIPQPDVLILAEESTKQIASGLTGGQFVITGVTPNACSSFVKDTIEICELVTSVQQVGGFIKGVYPNPSSDLVKCVLSTNQLNQVVLFDLHGKVVQVFKTSGAEFTMNVSGFAKGTYVLKVSSESASDHVRINIQ